MFATQAAGWCRSAHSASFSRWSTGLHVALRHLWVGPDQRRGGSGLQFGAGDRRDATGRRPRSFRPTSVRNGPASPISSSRQVRSRNEYSLLAMIFVFLFLCGPAESWSMPFMVILAVPLALFGAVTALGTRRMQFDVYSVIGLVMLIGLAAKNATRSSNSPGRSAAPDPTSSRPHGGRAAQAAPDPDDRVRLSPSGVVPLMLASGAGRRAASRSAGG